MEQNRISAIFRKFLSGRFSPDIEERVQKWIIKDDYTIQKEEASREYWEELKNEINDDTYIALGRVNQRTGPTWQDKRRVMYRTIFRVAAVLIPVILIAGGYFYLSAKQDIVVEISVANGEKHYLFLPDSTEVWLNAGTTIRYTDNFKGEERIVRLDGEAYFSVANNESRPFVVETRHLAVKVLGTRFNVKAYAEDEKIITTLESGKVEIATGQGETVILKPDEQLSYNSMTGTIELMDVVPADASGWINGQLIFDGSTFDEIICTLERRFNISVVNHSVIPSSRLYSVKFLNNERPDEIFTILEDITGVTFHQEGDKTLHITQ